MDTSNQSEYLSWAVHLKQDSLKRVELLKHIFDLCRVSDENLKDMIGHYIDSLDEDAIEAWEEYKQHIEEEEHEFG